jgi:hypothetical protein
MFLDNKICLNYDDGKIKLVSDPIVMFLGNKICLNYDDGKIYKNTKRAKGLFFFLCEFQNIFPLIITYIMNFIKHII